MRDMILSSVANWKISKEDFSKGKTDHAEEDVFDFSEETAEEMEKD